jgi:2-dehydro-3-deoxyphosphogluconate aldolase / (4S)-4-hydroxy-2-oxoglutarate aldolase
MNQDIVKQKIVAQGLMTLFYTDDVEVSVSILRTLYKEGIQVIEYVNRGVHALSNFKVLKSIIDNEKLDIIIGAGTIKNKEAAADFIAAGADFIICPTLNIEVAHVAKSHNILWIPGCITPTEIGAAENNGASIVKIFPCSQVSPAFIKTMQDIFPAMQFIPTGGVDATAESMESWFNVGVVAVGLGSRLISKDIVNQNNFTALSSKVKDVLVIITAKMKRIEVLNVDNVNKRIFQ